MDIVNIILLIVLIGLTAFFVATEFAIVKVRMTRIDQLIAEGNRNAKAAKTVLTHLDEYLSACQLGITITALGIGWIGEPTIVGILRPLLDKLAIPTSIDSIISFIIAFSFITFLHVVVGELAPKTFAIQKAEQVTLMSARPLIWFYRILFPAIWLLNHSARAIVSLFGLKPAIEHELAHSEEELRIILSESYKSGEINQSEYKYVNRVFDFDNRLAKEIMVPRTEMIFLSLELSLEENLEIINKYKFTRYPITSTDKDHVLGIINIKDLLIDLLSMDEHSHIELDLRSYLRPVIQVIETFPSRELLAKMQKEQIHMAILFDEYGGTVGLVTAEDMIEEIVGDIRDEFDNDEVPLVQKVGDNHYLLDGKVLISEVNQLLDLKISVSGIDTIGGWMLSQNYTMTEGDSIETERYLFYVKEFEDHHIKTIEVQLKREVNDF